MGKWGKDEERADRKRQAAENKLGDAVKTIKGMRKATDKDGAPGV